MEARKLLEGASYDPQEVAILGKAFNDAWENIKPTTVTDAGIEAARLKLAQAILIVAKAGPMEEDRIAEDAIELMFAQPSGIGSRHKD